MSTIIDHPDLSTKSKLIYEIIYFLCVFIDCFAIILDGKNYWFKQMEL